jgi:hypothetical protein
MEPGNLRRTDPPPRLLEALQKGRQVAEILLVQPQRLEMG